jgi:hypothetical protein
LLFKSKWDTLSVLKIENEKYFVSKKLWCSPFKRKVVDIPKQVSSAKPGENKYCNGHCG